MNLDYYKPTSYQEEYIDLRKIDISESLNDQYFIESEIMKFITTGFKPLYISATDMTRSSGYEAELIYSMLTIDDIECYFVIVDDPGLSGYDCCGSYVVYYSLDLNIFLEDKKYNEKEQEILFNIYKQ